jgi:hypothetical protein
MLFALRNFVQISQTPAFLNLDGSESKCWPTYSQTIA